MSTHYESKNYINALNDGAIGGISKNDPEAVWMSKLGKNVPLAEYHDTLYVTLMLLLKSEHIKTYFQRDIGNKSIE